MILIQMIAIDVLNNMLKFQTDWTNSFFEIVYTDQKDDVWGKRV